MNELKPWQMILIAAAVLVLGFTGWRMMSGTKVDQPDGYMTVDVMTGQLYMLQKGRAKGMLLPAKNPDTGDRTLYPVVQDESTGDWSLHEGYATTITEDMIKSSKVLTNQSQISILDSDPIVHVLMP